jgi:GntR family histidine utilization transcriptional repressor
VIKTYRDIKADVLDKITGGTWPPGEMLPNEADLAEDYGCARATVNRALRELAEEGLLERKRKSGTRVRAAPQRQARFDIPLTRREVEEAGAQYRYALVMQQVVQAPEWLRARMSLSETARVLEVIAMHYADGAPFQHEARWINLEALPQAEEQDFSKRGANEWLVETVPFSDVELAFSAAGADAGLSHHLGCEAGAALFRMERSTWFEERAITFVRLSYRPGHRMTARY